MNTQQIISNTALIALAAAAIGCVDNGVVGVGTYSTETRQQAVTVVPEFMITGADVIPDSLVVTELGLTITEIRLEPMWSLDSLAYATREAITVNFDVSGREVAATAEPLELPDAGGYLVSIRLEPRAQNDGDEPSSLRLEGFVQRDGAATPDDRDGRPQPMPFDGDKTSAELTDRHAQPMQWAPFEYQSRRAVFYTFNDVTFDFGEQFLTFSFDLQDWAVDVLEPISRAARSQSGMSNTVDATNQIDSSGNGVDALIRTGVVRSDRRGP